MLTFGSTVPLKHYSVLRPLILQYQIIWCVHQGLPYTFDTENWVGSHDT